jgi:hypothetical protein
MSTCRRRTIQFSKNLEYRKRRFSSGLAATKVAGIGRQPADAEFDARISPEAKQATTGSTNPKLNPQSNTQQRLSATQTRAAGLLPVLLELPGIWAGNRWESSLQGEPTCLRPYPKALFVLSSDLCQHPQSARTRAGNYKPYHARRRNARKIFPDFRSVASLDETRPEAHQVQHDLRIAGHPPGRISMADSYEPCAVFHICYRRSSDRRATRLGYTQFGPLPSLRGGSLLIPPTLTS